MKKNLVLVPTAMELSIIEPLLAAVVRETGAILELCGFGPIAAASRAAGLIATIQPDRVVLVGIGGVFREQLPLGAACAFQQAVCYGVGAGTGLNYRSAEELGWPHWTNQDVTDSQTIGDLITLAIDGDSSFPREQQLLTCCSASSDSQDVLTRSRRFPQAVVEDMEGFAVAMAGVISNTPVEIIRGVSNHVGDRDKRNWHVESALHSAAQLTLRMMEADG